MSNVKILDSLDKKTKLVDKTKRSFVYSDLMWFDKKLDTPEKYRKCQQLGEEKLKSRWCF